MDASKVRPEISLIVAVAENGAIGKDNDLLWHLSADLKRFKAITTGHVIIMGRRTYESFPKRPLPDRYHIVLSQSGAIEESGQVRVVPDLEAALACIPDGQEAFVIGGGQVYRQFLPYCQRAYVTEVRGRFEADTFFPALDKRDWDCVEEGEWERDEKSGLEYRFLLYRRKGCGPVPLRGI